MDSFLTPQFFLGALTFRKKEIAEVGVATDEAVSSSDL